MATAPAGENAGMIFRLEHTIEQVASSSDRTLDDRCKSPSVRQLLGTGGCSSGGRSGTRFISDFRT